MSARQFDLFRRPTAEVPERPRSPVHRCGQCGAAERVRLYAEAPIAGLYRCERCAIEALTGERERRRAARPSPRAVR